MSSLSCEKAWSRATPKHQIASRTSDLFAAYHQAPSIHLRNQIAQLNDRLAIKIAQRAQATCNSPLDDLIQLSRIGLLKAVEKFDPARRAAFSSFAVPYCQGEIKHHLRDHKNLVKTPRRWQETSDSARSLQQTAALHGRDISLDEAATCGLGLPKHRWQIIDQATQTQSLCSLDEDDTLQLAAESTLSLEEQEQTEAIKAALLIQLDTLPELMRQCIVEKFWAELSDELIGKRHRIPASEVQTLIENGLQKLREVACAHN